HDGGFIAMDGWRRTWQGRYPHGKDARTRRPTPARAPLSSRQDSDPSDVNVAGPYLSLQKRPLRMGSGGARLGGMGAVGIGNVDAETAAGVRGRAKRAD